MAQEIINIGTTPNDGTGDPLRTAFTKVNENFTELYDTADTQDLDFTGDSGTGAVELDSQTLNLVGTNGVQTTANGQTITIDTSSLDTRLTTAEADIDTNTASITTEETARIAADTTLQTNIDAEATTRGSADTTLQTNIDSEAATRLANDNTLQSNIDAEATTRLANDNTLQGNIDTEASTRSSADTALQGQIDSNDTDIANNAANIATNTANISSNDTDIAGLDSRLTTAEGNISSNDTDIATNASNIATNVTDIATNVTNIASNDTDISNLQSGKQDISEKNQANGYAPLDSGAKIPIANLPDSVVGQVEYQGTWDASTDDPTLPSASTVKGHYYVVSVGGTYETITYAIGDWIISNGVAWEKIDNTDAVTTVFGRLGAILANEGDYSAYYPLIADLTAAETDIATNASNISTNTSNISTNTSNITTNATNISSNDTDITALQNDKYDKTGGTISGNATITGNLIVDTDTLYVKSTTNNVGIGLTNATAKLHVVDTSNSGTNDQIVSGLNSTSPRFKAHIVSYNGVMSLYDSGTNEDVRITSKGDEDSWINNGGNVGIGTASPTAKLDIRLSGTTGKVAELHNNSGYGIGFTVESDGGVNTINSESNQALAFATNGASNERMRIDSSGYTKFTKSTGGVVASFIDETYGVDLAATATGGSIQTFNLNQTLNFNTYGTGYITFTTSGTSERVRITSGGNVGIGTDSPSSKLSIDAGAQQDAISINSSDGDGSYAVWKRQNETIGFVGNANALSLSGNTNFGVRATNDLVFAAGGGTERMRIDSSGNVSFNLPSIGGTRELQFPAFNATNAKTIIRAVGTSDYRQHLDILMNTAQADIAPTPVVRIENSGNVGIGTDSPALNASFDRVLHIHSPLGSLVKLTDNSTGPGALNGTDILQYGFDFYIINRENGDIRIDTNSTERMRVTGGGKINVNQYAGGAYLNIDGGAAVVCVETLQYGPGTLTHYTFKNSNGAVGSISTSGSSTAYNTSSDYRLKENVVPITGALDRVDALKPSRFNFIADADKTVDGFLAHEVAEVVPEAISGEKDAVEDYEVTPAVLDDEGNVIEEAVIGTRPVYQGIDQSKLVPLLVGAIQELKAEIELLKSQINN